MLSVRNDSCQEVELERGMPLARAMETVAALGEGKGSPLTDPESRARVLVKTGQFSLAAVKEVLQMSEVPLSSKRNNVLPVGQSEVRSLLLGLYCHGHQHGVTSATREKKWLVRLLIGTFRREYPGFPFTSIQINHGFACRPHVDRNNSGPSALVALGEFTGGQLWVHEPTRGA